MQSVPPVDESISKRPVPFAELETSGGSPELPSHLDALNGLVCYRPSSR